MPSTISQRSDQFDMALDLTAGRRGLAALGAGDRALGAPSAGDRGRGRAAERGARRELRLVCRARCRGHAIGNALWNGEELDEATRARVVGLYRLTFRDPGAVADGGASRSI